MNLADSCLILTPIPDSREIEVKERKDSAPAAGVARSGSSPARASNFRHISVDGRGYIYDPDTGKRTGPQVMAYDRNGVCVWDECPYCRSQASEGCFGGDPAQVAMTFKGTGWVHGPDGRLYNTRAGEVVNDTHIESSAPTPIQYLCAAVVVIVIVAAITRSGPFADRAEDARPVARFQTFNAVTDPTPVPVETSAWRCDQYGRNCQRHIPIVATDRRWR